MNKSIEVYHERYYGISQIEKQREIMKIFFQARDDRRDENITLSDLLPNDPVMPISYDTLIILLETIEKEMERIERSVSILDRESLKHHRVVQAVRAVCTFMGQIETQEISESLYCFVEVCEKFLDTSQVTDMHLIPRYLKY